MGLDHAILTNLETDESFRVLFNPDEYSLRKDNAFAQAAVPGLSSPLLQFVNGNLATLQMELLFDSLEEHRHAGSVVNAARSDVRRLTGPIVALMAIDADTHAPPRARFAWGDLIFVGVLTSVAQRFTMFLESGVPVRAQLEVTFAEYVNDQLEAKEVKRQTADFSRRHEVAEGETVTAIAQRVYGDARQWRPIAIANDLVLIRRLPAGLVLTLPPLPFRDPLTGEVHG